MNSVAVLTENAPKFRQMNYLLRLISEAWRDMGVEVHVTDDQAQAGKTDLAVLHYDGTFVPQTFQSRGAVREAVNGRVTDISKRHISSNLVRSWSDDAGPVIVKSNLNYGGQPELCRIAARFPLLGRLARALPWSITGVLSPESYPVFNRASDVPWLARINPRLVVERFLPERAGKHYCLRQYIFLGDREINNLLYSECPVIKAKSVVGREEVPDVPPGVRQFRKSLGIDYGRFDYVMRDGVPIIFDVNKTPGFDPAAKLAPIQAMVERLAPGIRGIDTVTVRPAAGDLGTGDLAPAGLRPAGWQQAPGVIG